MAKPVRVLHIVDGLGPGGVERSLWKVVRMADADAVIHRVVTFYPEDARFVYADRMREAGVYRARKSDVAANRSRMMRRVMNAWLDAIPKRGRKLLWPLLSAFQPLALHARGYRGLAAEFLRFRPDVIHGYGFHGLHTGVWLKRLTRRPFIYTIPCRLVQMIDAGAWWLPRQLSRLHHCVDAFYTDPDYRGEFTDCGVPPAKLFTFLAAVDTAAIEATLAGRTIHRAEVGRRLRIPAGAPIALSVGRLHRSKGHHYAVEALPRILASVPDLHWVLLGEGEERPALGAAIAHAGVGERAHVLGFVEDPYRFYAASDVYLRTAIYEGENTSSYDAMAFSLPVAGFDTGCPNDLLGQVGHGVWVPNGRADALAAAVVRILTLPDRGRTLGHRGRRFCEQHLDIRKTVDIYTAKYVELREQAFSSWLPASGGRTAADLPPEGGSHEMAEATK